jgi:LysM repeat protein
MDTISRENNSMLPAIGIAVGAVALLLSAYSAINISKVKVTLAAHEDKLAGLPDIASQASAAAAKADAVNTNLNKIATETQGAFTAVGTEIGNLKGEIAKLEESHKEGPAMGRHGHGGPAVAGPGEYVVKPGDTLAKIARGNGVSLSDLKSVNEGVDSKHLKVGQKLHIPQKGAAAAAAPAPEPAAATAPATP